MKLYEEPVLMQRSLYLIKNNRLNPYVIDEDNSLTEEIKSKLVPCKNCGCKTIRTWTENSGFGSYTTVVCTMCNNHTYNVGSDYKKHEQFISDLIYAWNNGICNNKVIKEAKDND